MIKIDPASIVDWKIATKTKSLRAKALINLLVDRSILNKFLVDTLEGREILGDGNVICIGESNDAWQQTPKKLLQKYDVRSIDADGWMMCEPRPDNAVFCVEVTKEMTDADGNFYIIGHWGDASPEGPVQKGVAGDFICRNQTDLTDQWIVRKKIFVNSYSIKS